MVMCKSTLHGNNRVHNVKSNLKTKRGSEAKYSRSIVLKPRFHNFYLYYFFISFFLFYVFKSWVDKVNLSLTSSE